MSSAAMKSMVLTSKLGITIVNGVLTAPATQKPSLLPPRCLYRSRRRRRWRRLHQLLRLRAWKSTLSGANF